MTDRILCFIPMYNCERQIPRVLGRIDARAAALLAEVIVVDNGSRDGSVAAAQAALARLAVPGTVLRNDANYNLGGSHKVAFDYALDHGFTHVLVLHGDDQADIADAVPWLESGAHRQLDCLLGSRFGRGARLIGYSRFRTLGNHVFNLIFSLAAGRWLTDLGSGLNLFATGWMQDRFYRSLNDDLTFNNHLLLAICHRRARFRFAPISWREEDQVSNVKLFRQARKTLGIALGYLFLRGRYLARAHATRPADGYTAKPA
jgi:glycosyltransferase involved in cell wall biosynthesis